MCRLLAYAGPPRSLAEALREGEHSLEVQSYAPKEMETALLNADGFGVCWYPLTSETPGRYRSVLPLWADANFHDLAPAVHSPVILGAIRSATPGIGFGLANTPPYRHGAISFAHNGFLANFAGPFRRRVAAALGDEAYAAIEGTSDSEHLFALLLDELFTGSTLASAARAMVTRVDSLREGERVLLAFVASDGHELVGYRGGMDTTPPTLYRRARDGRVELRSEPDGEGWELLPPDHVQRDLLET